MSTFALKDGPKPNEPFFYRNLDIIIHICIFVRSMWPIIGGGVMYDKRYETEVRESEIEMIIQTLEELPEAKAVTQLELDHNAELDAIEEAAGKGKSKVMISSPPPCYIS